MACGKPPEPGRASPASDRMNFVLTQTHDLLDNLERTIGNATPGEVLDRAMLSAERAIERLKAAGAPPAQIRKFEGKLGSLKGLARARLVDAAKGLTTPRRIGERGRGANRKVVEFSDLAAERNAKTARAALTSPGHWAHESFKKDFFRMVEGNATLPDSYRAQLLRDIDLVLKANPAAGGFVSAMVNRGQTTTFADRMASRNTKDHFGTAYEIMGVAALCQKESRASNTKHAAPPLRIDPANDRLSFGAKAALNHKYDGRGKIGNRSRRTIEGDAHLFQNQREIAIDLKHVKDSKTKYTSKDLQNQIEAVAEKILDGQLHEFHFVTNGSFHENITKQIDTINDHILQTDKSCSPIAYHEHVTTLVGDPHSGGAV